MIKLKMEQLYSFLDNEYLDKYCELIENNLNTKKEKGKTQSHHIIPVCYYKNFKLKVDNSSKNKVNLLYKDHILAHYYLCLCTEGNLKYKLANAFYRLYNAPYLSHLSLNDSFFSKLDYLSYIREEWEKGQSKINSNKIQSLEEGTIFNSITEAEIYYSPNHKFTGNIVDSIKKIECNINRSAYGQHWIKIKDKPYSKEERENILNNLPPLKDSGKPKGYHLSEKSKKILSLKLTGQKRNQSTKNNMIKAWDKRRGGPKVIKVKKSKEQISLETSQRMKGNKLHQGYSQTEYQKSIVSKISKENNSKKIQNLNTGEVYNSMSEIEIKYSGHTTSNLGGCIKNGHQAYGYYWIKIKDKPYSKEERENILNNLQLEHTKRRKNNKWLKTEGSNLN